MTDRELLEKAAKAAGLVIRPDPHGILRDCTGFHMMANIFAAPLWNPLTDDGDALRLAVQLCIPFSFWKHNGVIAGVGPDVSGISFDTICPYAATRRAIVRAAAETGASL